MKTMLFKIIFILGFLLITSFAFFRRFSEEVETISTNTTLTTRVKGVPVVQINPSTYIATYSSQALINCIIASASPAATQVCWQRSSNNQILRIDNGDQGYQGSTTSTPSLTINVVNTANAGVYTCFALNAVGTGTSNLGTVTVTGGTPPITSIPQPSYTQITGQQIILGCTVNSPNSPLQEVQWTFTNNQGQTTDPISISNSNGKYSGSSVNSPSLTINSVASTDQGVYSCKARNSVGTTTNNPTTSLAVTGSVPVVQINPSTYTATYGSQAVINCNIVSASPAATQVYWQKSSNNQILRIDNGDQGYQGSTTSTPSLTINVVNTANAGVYTCFASNAVGTGTSNLGTVTVTGGLLSVFVTPQNQIVINGNRQRITCTVSGTPSAQNIAWLFTAAGSSQQTQLNTANRQRYSFGTTQDPFLTVLNFQPSDAGTYVCRATNAAGSTSSNPGSTLLDISLFKWIGLEKSEENDTKLEFLNCVDGGNVVYLYLEDIDSWIISCSEYLPLSRTALCHSEPILPGYEDVSRTTLFEKLNYQTSMESLHGIESTALLATFILTVLSMRIVSEEQLIKDTVSHSLIVKTTTKEARQNVPTKAEDEAVRHCELCINHDQAIAYCMTCKLYICMPCNDLHKRVWTLMNHTVCPFNHM